MLCFDCKRERWLGVAPSLGPQAELGGVNGDIHRMATWPSDPAPFSDFVLEGRVYISGGL